MDAHPSEAVATKAVLTCLFRTAAFLRLHRRSDDAEYLGPNIAARAQSECLKAPRKRRTRLQISLCVMVVSETDLQLMSSLESQTKTWQRKASTKQCRGHFVQSAMSVLFIRHRYSQTLTKILCSHCATFAEHSTNR